MSDRAAGRSASWKWWVSGVLLAASAINYMDRQALSGASVRITEEFGLKEEQYGNLEFAFGWAFAAGSLLFGVLADRAPVRWLYPAVLLLWSVAGFATGLARGYDDLLLCRTLLGFFEAGHWPCALKTTQRLLEARDRPMGNSVLQSGTSIGAIAAMLILLVLPAGTGTWRFAFQATGLAGLAWIAAWLLLVRRGDLETLPPAPHASRAGAGAGLLRALMSRKMLAILVVVALINTTWQILRAWLPKFLHSGREMPENHMLLVTIGFYIASDVGCLGVGVLTLWLQRRGASVHGARSRAFLVSALLCALAVGAAALLPLGWPLFLMLLIAGAGALGVFPIYYSLTQDISARHQGKVTGIGSVAAWAFSSPAQKYYGRLVDRTGSYDLGFAIAGCLPLVAFLFLRLLGESHPGAGPGGGKPMKRRVWTRRRFVKALAAAAGGGILAGGCASPGGGRGGMPGPKRVALLATEVRRHSHAQHFIDRLLEGYGWEGQWRHPEIQLVALYVDQFPEGDLARERSRRFGVPIFATVEEALALGGSKLAVDGVLIIAEHGKYPRNEKGQTLYPRHAWFERTVRVFEESGRAVPVFNDKHLSTAWDQCAGMVDDSRRLEFPFLAGSSLPVTWRIPSIEMPLGAPLVESLCACYGGVDSYDFHGLETAQCMSERRAGGEAGVASVLALRGEKAWTALEEREATSRLLLAALSRSHTLAAPPGYTFPVPSIAWARQTSPDAVAYFVEHRDGFRTSMLLLSGLVQDFTYAGLLRSGEVISCQMHLPMPGHISTTADFFNPLLRNIERMVVEGRAPYPVERTLLTSGMTLFAVESLHRGGIRVETAGMREVAYQAPAGSTFWRS